MKFRKCMIALVLSGVFLCGLGVGVGFVEFSELEYEGSFTLGEEQTAEKTLVWELGEEEYDRLELYSTDAVEGIEIVEDWSVPKGEIQLEITYNENFGEPFLDNMAVWEEDDGLEKEKKGRVYLHFFSQNGTKENEIRLLMQARDQILSDLKEKKFRSYETGRIYQVKIVTNPVNREKIQTRW